MDTYPIDKLHNWEQNPRTISKEGFERLKKQITKLGQYKPLLITKDGTVLGGNMRLKAYQELGIKEAWVSVVDADTEEKKIEYALSDNDRVGRYDDDQLANLLGSYPDVEWDDYSVDLKEPTLVKDILDQFKEVIEDEVPEVPKVAESKLGEVYQLGRHRLMCGDATKIEDVEKLMDGKKADMVFTDPPYGMRLDADYSDMVGISRGNKYEQVKGDEIDYDPKPIFDYFNYCKEIFIWGGDYFAEKLPNRNEGSFFVWDKTGGGVRTNSEYDKMFGSNFELCWSKAKHKRQVIGITWKGFFGLSREDTKHRVHPTQKPLPLPAWFYKKFSKENDIIVDLYGGSGSFLIACEQTNRICYMLEIDPLYCDVIRKRYAKFIGKEDSWEAITPLINS